MSKYLFSFFLFPNLFSCFPISNNNNVTEPEPLPDYNTYKLLHVQQLNYSTPKPTEDEIFDLKSLVQANSGVLCAFSDETIKNHPSLALYTLYCAFLALAWCALIFALCFRTIKQSIERLQVLIDGFRPNRQNYNVDEGRSEILSGVFPIGSTTTSV